MMIDLVEEEEEIKIQVLLGDYLDNSDSYIDMQSSSTSSPTFFQAQVLVSLSYDLNDLEDEIEDIVLEGIEFLQAHRYLIQRNTGLPKDQEVLPAPPEDR